MARSVRRPWIAGSLVLLGGLLIVGGALLPWLDTGGLNMGENDISGSPTGLELSSGVGVMAAGGAAIVLGLLGLLLRRGRRIVGALGLVAGAIALVLIVPTINDPVAAYVEFVASELSVDAEDLDSLPELFEQGLLSSDLHLAVWGALAGGVMVVLGSVGLLVARRHGREQRPAADAIAEQREAPDPAQAASPDAGTPDEPREGRSTLPDTWAG